MKTLRDLPGATIETGNKVFDPYGFAQTTPYGSENFEWMRYAEVHLKCFPDYDGEALT